MARYAAPCAQVAFDGPADSSPCCGVQPSLEGTLGCPVDVLAGVALLLAR